MAQKVFLFPLFALLCSCAVSKQIAPIEFHHDRALKASRGNGSVHRGQNQSNTIIPKSALDKEDYILPDTPNSNESFVYHEVKIGEEIEDIAEHYGQTVSEIARVNGISYPYIIDEFQILKIPTIKNTASKKQQTKKVSNKSESFVKPLEGKIVSKFGEKNDAGPNKGINIAAASGAEVRASASGKVVYSAYDSTYGNLIIIKSNNDLFTSYAHIKSTEVAPGDYVHQGEIIAYVGSTGKVKTPQLHFGVRKGKTPQDPMKFINY